MRKNVIMIALVIISIVSIVYGQVQKAEAIKQMERALQNERLAREMSEKARIAMEQAEKVKLVSEQQMIIALEQAKLAAERAEQLFKQSKKSRWSNEIRLASL